MKGDSKKYMIGLLLLLGVGLILYFFGNPENNKPEPKETEVEAINWEKDYNPESNHPYGTYFLHELMESGREGLWLKDIDVSVRDYFENDSLQIKADHINYVFIGEALKLWDKEVDTLLHFASKGNTVFLAAEYFPTHFFEEIYNSHYSGYLTTVHDTSVILQLTASNFGDDYRLNNRVDKKLVERGWRALNYGVDTYFSFEYLGKVDYNYCFVKFQYGQGEIIMHTVPQAFTNEFLKTSEGREYVEVVTSYLKDGVVLWDNYTPFVYQDQNVVMDKEHHDPKGRNINQESIIKYLLEQESLRWAYFLILGAMVTFVVFMGKRRQKVIPTIRKNNNTSLEFTETVSRIYFLQGQHNKLIKHMETIFRNKIKTRYYIQYTDDETYAERIAKKSGVPLSEVQGLLKKFKSGSRITEVSDFYLEELYQQLQQFYKKAH